GKRQQLLTRRGAAEARIRLVARVVTTQVREAVVREVTEGERRAPAVEAWHIRRIDLQIRRLLMRHADRIGRALLPPIGDLMVERGAEDAVAAMEEDVHIRPAERRSAWHAGAAELGPADEAQRHIG